MTATFNSEKLPHTITIDVSSLDDKHPAQVVLSVPVPDDCGKRQIASASSAGPAELRLTSKMTGGPKGGGLR
jgi:hypothetical protein